MSSSTVLPIRILVGALLILLLVVSTGIARASGTSPSPGVIGHANLATGSGVDSTPSSERPLWPRIRKGFRLDLSYTNPRIEVQRRWYQNNPDYLERVFQRAQPFLLHLVSEAEKRHLPLELILLPVVESAFDPFAYSHGRASGIWQFIPGTSKRFGLKQNWWYDGRRDVIASTDAALTYLATLNRMFKGDWLHALASYNAGEGNVRKSIQRNLDAGLAESFWALELPNETADYVPRLLALAQIVADPERYHVNLPDVTDTPQIAVIELEGQLDLHQAATLAGLGIEDIYRLNPGYNHWATDPEGPHRLVLPLALAESFKSAYTELPARERIKWVRHQVKAGESLIGLAERYHTTVALIRDANGLASHTIRQDSRLLIPTASLALNQYTLSAASRLAERQQKSPVRAGERIEHQVKAGDTLWDIAVRYGVDSGQVARWNGMAPGDLLQAGATLVIWRKSTRIVSTPSTDRTVIRKVGYQIRRGDSLSSIAQRFNVSVRDLIEWNTLRADAVLRPGRTLRVFVDVTAGRETES